MRRRSRSASQTTPFSPLHFLKSAASNVLSQSATGNRAVDAAEAPSRLEGSGKKGSVRRSSASKRPQLASLNEQEGDSNRGSRSNTSVRSKDSARVSGSGSGNGNEGDGGGSAAPVSDRGAAPSGAAKSRLEDKSDSSADDDASESLENTGPCEFCSVEVAYVPQPAPTPVMCWNCSKITVFPAVKAPPRTNASAAAVLTSSESLTSSVLSRASAAAKNAGSNDDTATTPSPAVRLASSEKLSRRHDLTNSLAKSTGSTARLQSQSDGADEEPLKQNSTGSRIRRKMASLRAKAAVAGSSSPTLGTLRRFAGSDLGDNDSVRSTDSRNSNLDSSPNLATRSQAQNAERSAVPAPDESANSTADQSTPDISKVVPTASFNTVESDQPAGPSVSGAKTPSPRGASPQPAQTSLSPSRRRSQSHSSVALDSSVTSHQSGQPRLGGIPERALDDSDVATGDGKFNRFRKAGVSFAKAGASTVMKAGQSTIAAGASTVKAGASSVKKAGHSTMAQFSNNKAPSGDGEASSSDLLRVPGASSADADGHKQRRSSSPSDQNKSSRSQSPDSRRGSTRSSTPVSARDGGGRSATAGDNVGDDDEQENLLASSSRSASASLSAAGGAAAAGASKMLRRAGAAVGDAVKAGKTASAAAVKAGKSRLESSMGREQDQEATSARGSSSARTSGSGKLAGAPDDDSESSTSASSSTAAQEFEQRKKRVEMLKNRVSVRHATKTPPPLRRSAATPQGLAMMRRRQSMRSPRIATVDEDSGDQGAVRPSPQRRARSAGNFAGGRFDRRRHNLNAYSPDNLAYLKAQTALMELQAAAKDHGDEPDRKSDRQSGDGSSTAAPTQRPAVPQVKLSTPAGDSAGESVAPLPFPGAKLHEPGERYRRLMLRRQSRRGTAASPVPVVRPPVAESIAEDESSAGALPSVTPQPAGNRFAARRRGGLAGAGQSSYLDAQKALLAIAERKKETEAASNGGVANDESSSNQPSVVKDTPSEPVPPIAGATAPLAAGNRFAARRRPGQAAAGQSSYLDAQKALQAIAERKKQMEAAAAPAHDQGDDDVDSLLDSLEKTPLEELASSADAPDQDKDAVKPGGRSRSASRGSSGALAAVAAAMLAEQQQEQQQQQQQAGGVVGDVGSPPKGMSGFVRAPPARFQKLLQKRQEQFSAAMAEDTDSQGSQKPSSISTDVSIEQYAMVKSLEDFYKGLGQQSDGGSQPMAFAGMRRISERLDDADEDGDTPLHQAAYDGQLEIVAYLHKKGADINRRNAFDETPLYVAAMNGQLAVVQYLAEHGANVEALSAHGNSALDAATDDVRAWLVGFVRRRRGRRHSHDPKNGLPAEVQALRQTLSLSDGEGSDSDEQADGEGTVRSLSSPGAVVDSRAADGSPAGGRGSNDPLPKSPSRSPRDGGAGAEGSGKSPEAVASLSVDLARLAMSEDLLDAAQQGDVAEIERLLRQGALPTFVDETDGWTPLHHAAFEGHDKAAAVLLKAGAVVDAPDLDGYTPLHWAVCQDATVIAKLLLERGAAVDGRAGDAQSAPLHLAARADDAADLCRLLCERGADVGVTDADGETPLHHAADAGDADVCKLLVARNADPRARGKAGATPLHYACASSHLAVARVLLDRGAKADDRDDDMETPMHWICKSNELLTPTVTMALMALLVQHGASVNATDASGDRPLHAAAREGHHELVTWLCEHEAMVDAQNDSGWTALHCVVLSDASDVRLAIVRDLIERWKANPDPRDKHGESPLQMAAYEDHLAVARYLVEEAGADLRPVMPWAETAADSRVAQWLETQRRDWEDEQRRKAMERRQREAEKKAAAQKALLRATAEAFADDDDDELMAGLDPDAARAAIDAARDVGGGAASGAARSMANLLRGDGGSDSFLTRAGKATATLRRAAQQLAAVKEEEQDDARRQRDLYLALGALGMVLVAIVWRKISAILAILLAVVFAAAIFAKRFYDSL